MQRIQLEYMHFQRCAIFPGDAQHSQFPGWHNTMAKGSQADLRQVYDFFTLFSMHFSCCSP